MTSNKNKSNRRSARVRDPIVVSPGFGTQKDLEKLSGDLGLSQEACRAVMESRGRGIRSATGSSSTEAAAAPVSTAWADFLKEEGMNENDDDKKKNEETSSDKDDDDDVDEQEVGYKLPLEPSWMKQADSDSETKKKKQKLEDPPFGVLVQSGTLDSSVIGRKRVSDINSVCDFMVPTVILSPKIRIKRVISGCNAAHALALTTTGHVYAWGRNSSNQLSSALPETVPLPTLLEQLVVGTSTNMVDGAVGKAHSVLLDDTGQLWACGHNKQGQCGIQNFVQLVPHFRKCVGISEPVVQVSCGQDFTVALSNQGELFTTGSSEHGQLGNGETGEYFVSANKLAFANCNVFTKRTTFCHDLADSNKVETLQEDVRLGSIACGKHHTIAIEAASSHKARRVFTWGCGDYGCLGHGIQKDEYYPRMLPPSLILGTPFRASAGAQCGMILTENGHVYYWGKHRSVGEATMRPTLVDALANNGHVVTHVSGGNQSMVCCTNQGVTIAWGQGPYGELGFGPNRKSSSKPDFVTALDQCRILDLACGYGTTVYCVQQENQDKRAIDKLLPMANANAIHQALGGEQEGVDNEMEE